MCELLFVSSGFLVGYNYYNRTLLATYQTSCKYSYKHLRSFYPLHIIISFYWIYAYKGKFNLTDYEMLIFHFLLLKVWSSYKSFAQGFYGLTWFISALLFCYFLSPFLLGGIQNINNSLVIFSFVAFIRVLIEQLIKNGAKNIMNFNFHFNPVIRLMDYYLGMLMIPLFLKVKNYCDKIKNKLVSKIINIKICLYNFFSLFENIRNISDNSILFSCIYFSFFGIH